MSETPPVGEFRMPGLAGVPEGLTAFAQPKPDGTFSLDRSGRPKVSKLHLRVDADLAPERPEGVLADRDWNWLTASPRQWTSIVERFGTAARAWEVTTALALAGCGSIEHRFAKGTLQHPPQRWQPHAELKAAQAVSARERSRHRETLETEAAALHLRLADTWPGAAASLNLPLGGTQLAWVVRAARDLADGTAHDGVRAFVQAHHPDDDKAREDLPILLRESGWETEALRVLGVDRSPYIGVAGPIRAKLGTRSLDWNGWPGPHDLRLPHGQAIELSCPANTERLVVIENRQAAETISDHYPDLPVVWCRGHHSDRVLDAIEQLARHCVHTFICTDADLGGLRIAARLYERLDPVTTLTVLDVGLNAPAAGRRFSAQALAQLAAHKNSPEPIRAFAAAIASRGRAVVQEAYVRQALHSALGSAGLEP